MAKLFFIAVVLSIFSATSYAVSEPEFSKCAAVSCLLPTCKPGETLKVPQGQCCPVCVPNCAAVSCLRPVCSDGEKLQVPEGQCCPVCVPDCTAISCLPPICEEGENLQVPKGECCPVCVRECEILGQTFLNCASPCQRTCSNPNPNCIKVCVQRCECPSGEVIDTRAGRCVPQVKCSTTEDLCALKSCPNGFRCKVFNGEAYCDPDCSLNNGGCLSNQTCQLREVSCIRASCPPLIDCLDYDPCAAVRCANGFRCKVSNGEAYCDPDCSLNNGGCSLGQTCHLQSTPCKLQPCPPTRICECPSQCSKKFCRKNKNAICSNPGPREIPGCTGDCQLTYCNACYFSSEALPRPQGCSQCRLSEYQSNTECFRNWSKCIETAHDERYNQTSSRRRRDFRCYSPECFLRG